MVQLFSYPGDYVSQNPSVERVAETLDKFEEDVLEATQPAVRGHQQVCVRFGEPVPVERVSGQRDAVARLTDTLEERVQQLLDRINADLRDGGVCAQWPWTAPQSATPGLGGDATKVL